MDSETGLEEGPLDPQQTAEEFSIDGLIHRLENCRRASHLEANDRLITENSILISLSSPIRNTGLRLVETD